MSCPEAGCTREVGHRGRHEAVDGRQWAPRRTRPPHALTLAPGTWARLDEIAARLGVSRSEAAEHVIAAAALPKKRPPTP